MVVNCVPDALVRSLRDAIGLESVRTHSGGLLSITFPESGNPRPPAPVFVSMFSDRGFSYEILSDTGQQVYGFAVVLPLTTVLPV